MRTSIRIISAIALTAACSLTSFAEVIPGTTLSVDFQNAFIQGNGRKISAYRVPVTDVPSGVVTYFDIDFNLTVNENGINFDRVNYVALTSVPATSVQNLIAGNYVSADGTLFSLVRTAGLNGGRDQWTLHSITNGKTYVAIFATGPLNGHPILSSRMATACATRDAGVFGSRENSNFNISGVWGGSSFGARVKQIDNAHLEFGVLDSNCSSLGSAILTKS